MTSEIGKIDQAEFDRLYLSLKHGCDSTVLEFLEGGGDPNLRNREGGWALLHAAAYFGRKNLVKVLLARGADIETLTAPGFTPLAMAAHSAQPTTVQLLLAAGASLECRPLGMTLLDSLQYARRNSKKVRELLSKATAWAPDQGI